ncbi:MAG: heme o synthase [Pseudomonadota bacterium]|nr:heme o synthase [Pseudomonadota bacterium]
MLSSQTDPGVAQASAGRPGIATVEDFFALMKPRVMSLVLFTALVGLVAAPEPVHPWLAFVSLLAIAIGAGASGALNMWYDADVDALMRRTALRPVPRGRVAPGEALGFGLFLAGVSVVLLGLAANWLAAWLLAFTIVFYVVVYTMWLKRRTPQNIVIGGAAGAFPPIIGWAVATGSITWAPVALFLIIFIWTPPHFWALALCRIEDYARAGVPMLPVVAGIDETRRQILVYSVIMVPVSLAPAFFGIAGIPYLVVAGVLGMVFVRFAWLVRQAPDVDGMRKAARRLFGYSILYLFAIFAVILAEQARGLVVAA